MKQKQNDESYECFEAAGSEPGPIIGDHHRVIADADDAENQQYHDRAKPPQCRTELEHVPRHHGSRSIHNNRAITPITKSNSPPEKQKPEFQFGNPSSRIGVFLGVLVRVYGFLLASMSPATVVMESMSEIEREREGMREKMQG